MTFQKVLAISFWLAIAVLLLVVVYAGLYTPAVVFQLVLYKVLASFVGTLTGIVISLIAWAYTGSE